MHSAINDDDNHNHNVTVNIIPTTHTIDSPNAAGGLQRGEGTLPLLHEMVAAGKVVVLDAHGGWLSEWHRNFAAYQIAHLRSDAGIHPGPHDMRELLGFAHVRNCVRRPACLRVCVSACLRACVRANELTLCHVAYCTILRHCNTVLLLNRSHTGMQTVTIWSTWCTCQETRTKSTKGQSSPVVQISLATDNLLEDTDGTDGLLRPSSISARWPAALASC